MHIFVCDCIELRVTTFNKETTTTIIVDDCAF